MSDLLSRYRSPLRYALTALLSWALLAGLACDQVAVEESAGPAPRPIVQSKTMRSFLSVDGLGSLFEAAHPEGLAIEADPRQRQIGGHSLSIGPLSQSLAIDELETTVSGSTLEFVVSALRPRLLVPVRLGSGSNTRICKFELTADRWTVEFGARDNAPVGWALQLVDAPSFRTIGLQVNPDRPCPPLVDEEGLVGSLGQQLVDYAETAIHNGAERFVGIPLFETLGLPRSSFSLRRLSSFSSRSGFLRILGQLPTSGGIRLDERGLETDLDLGISARRAPCAPPVDLPMPSGQPAGPLTAGDLQQAGADMGLALAGSLLGRLGQASATAGFLCRGLEAAPGDDGDRQIARHEARLADIGLDSVPVSVPLETVISPGKLPDVTLQPAPQTLRLSWESLTVELYGEVAGARVRLLNLTTSADFVLRPTTRRTDALDFALTTITVRDVGFGSPWSAQPPRPDQLGPWTRRLLFLVFEDAFLLPLPVRPAAPLQLVGSRVRSDDLLLLFDLRAR